MNRQLIATIALALFPFGLAARAEVGFVAKTGEMLVRSTQGLLLKPVSGESVVVPDSIGARGFQSSPDGEKIVFAVGEGEKVAVKLFDVATKSTKQLLDGVGPPFAWREDGKQFTGFRSLGSGKWEAVSYNLISAGITLKTELATSTIEAAVAIPNTDDVALLAGEGDERDILLVEGGETNKLTKTGDLVGLSLSSDLKSLLWIRKGKDARYVLGSVYSFSLDKRSVVRIPFPERVAPLNQDAKTGILVVDSATLSPDGKSIAFTMQFSKVIGPKADFERVVATVALTDQKANLLWRIRTAPAERRLRPQIAWSPDSKMLAVEASAGGAVNIKLIPADGSAPR